MNNKTAILIFANSAEKDLVSQSFSAHSLFDALNTLTIKIAKKTGLPYFYFSESDQHGTSFGERFTNAMQVVYDLGFETIISIGNDIPHLKSSHILKTVEKLRKHTIVLGPSTDGGFYLIGLKKTHFNKAVFLEMPWQTSNLNRSMSKLINSKNEAICFLEVLTDIDSAADFERVINRFQTLSKTIKLLLLLHIFIDKTIFSNLNSGFENFILNQPFNKGSPILRF